MEKHFTATVYLLAKVGGEVRVLLHKHKKINIWLGVGGHVEKNENPYETAIREVEEETGIIPSFIPSVKHPVNASYVKQLPVPYFLFEFKISARKKEPAHYHIDLVYIGTVKNPRAIRMHEKFRWFSAKELRKLTLQKEVITITQKALEIGGERL